MSFLEREADRLRSALRQTPSGPQFDRLYAAQAALHWAIDPTERTSPLDYIEGRSNPTVSKAAGLEGCPSSSHQDRS
jgi:hypothetical protein